MRKEKRFRGAGTVLAVMGIVWVLAIPVHAAPNLVNYQGELTDSGGAAVPDASYSMVFRVFDTATAGTPLWEESQSVTTAGGVYNVLLGSGTTNPSYGTFDASLFSADNRWLEVEVNGEILTPRQRITSGAFSLQAQEAAHAVSADSLSGPLDLTGSSPGGVVRGTDGLSGNFGYLGGSTYGAYGSGAIGLYGLSLSGAGYGTYGKSNFSGNYGYLGSGSYGAYGSSGNNYGYMGSADYGVYGIGAVAGDVGVYGKNNLSSNYGFLGGDGSGVYGSGGQALVLGQNTYGVYGSNSWSFVDALGGEGYGVFGENSSSGNFGYLGGLDFGVYGESGSGNAVEGMNNASGSLGRLGTPSYGVHGISTDSYGVYGESTNSYGVYGKNLTGNNYGALGAASSGVYGWGTTYGLYGTGPQYGVLGSIISGEAGVYGWAGGGAKYGVLGSYGSGSGWGYVGNVSTGVYGYASGGSTSAKGVHGESPYGTAVYGESTDGVGVYGKSATSYAGDFSGPVRVSGDIQANAGMQVTGTLAANGGVQVPLTYYTVSAVNTPVEQTVITASHTLCALTQVKMQALDPGTYKWCQARPNGDGTWTLGARGGNTTVICEAYCF